MNTLPTPAPPPKSTAPSPGASLSARIWGMLPWLFFLAIGGAIYIISDDLSTEKARIADERQQQVTAIVPAANVILLQVAPQTMVDRLSLPGVFEPWTRLDLLARISGTIDQVAVREGDRVKKGQILAHIEEADFRLVMDSAQAANDLARAEYDRAAGLYKREIIAKAEFDKLAAQVTTTRAALANAALALSRTAITAPLDGIIQSLPAKQGGFVSVGDPLAHILDIDTLKAVIGIPESDVATVRTLDRIHISIPALDNAQRIGRRHFLAPSPDSSALLYRLELAIDNADTNILPGMFLRAEIIKNQVQNALAVPLYAVINRNDKNFIFVEKEGIAQRREITTGIVEGWKIEVRQGLSAGDRVVVEGHRDLEDGKNLNVVRIMQDPDKPKNVGEKTP